MLSSNVSSLVLFNIAAAALVTFFELPLMRQLLNVKLGIQERGMAVAVTGNFTCNLLLLVQE